MSDPKLLNLIEIETRWGYRSFELYQGSILAFQQPIDLLAVSAFSPDLKILDADPSQYPSVAYTLVGALKTQAGINVASHAKDCEFDLRAALGCWISRPTSSPVFKRIVCVEDIGLVRPVEEAVENLFVSLAVLEAKSIGVGTLLLPLLGTGGMGLDPERIMHSLLTSAQGHFSRLPRLERIFFVELDPRKAEALNQAMNKVLGRVKVAIPKGELIRGVRRDILERIEAAAALAGDAGSRPLADLRRVIGGEESRSFEIGIAGRRLAEFVVQDFAGVKKGRPLLNGIEDLAAHGVADWIRSYLHTLRVFGNESAHEKGHERRNPPALSEADIALCFFCILRVLDFWVESRRGRG